MDIFLELGLWCTLHLFIILYILNIYNCSAYIFLLMRLMIFEIVNLYFQWRSNKILWFSQQLSFRLWPSPLWHRLLSCLGNSVSEKHASNFRAEVNRTRIWLGYPGRLHRICFGSAGMMNKKTALSRGRMLLPLEEHCSCEKELALRAVL